MLTIYLAGPIRSSPNENEYDVKWREYFQQQVRQRLSADLNKNLRFISPMDGKTFIDGQWYAHGFKTTINGIFHQDRQSIKQSDLIVANLLSLGEDHYWDDKLVAGGYPCIGTLMELGMATVQQKEIITILPEDTFVTQHPFIRATSMNSFSSVYITADYTVGIIKTLLGDY